MQSLLPLAREVASLLVARKETLAVAESSAGGLIAASLLAVPGASAYFLGGAVVYTARARRLLMGITNEEMTGLRSSSEPYARLLATRSKERFGSTWGLAETGASGPSGNSYGDAPGHSCIALVGPDSSGGESNHAFTLETGDADRERNMRAFAAAALEALHARLLQLSAATT
jgi:PncC family amidohydrolase